MKKSYKIEQVIILMELIREKIEGMEIPIEGMDDDNFTEKIIELEEYKKSIKD